MKATSTAEAVGLVFGPCSLKQQMVLLDNTTDILITGGGAGSGKSYTCLTKALEFIKDPAARVLIVRKTFPQLKISGGLWDESHLIYPHFGGIPKVQSLTWKFKNGATIQLAAIPDNLLDWQGLQATHILVDEIAEFTQDEILFLISRLRSTRYVGHKSLMGTCNPSRESFLFNWVEYSLDETTGIPKAGTEEIVRYFITVNGSLYWGNSEEELWQQHGMQLGLKRGRADEPGVNFLPKSFRFIPMTIYDNPILLKNNPQYLANLLSQPRVNQLRYLHGSWTAKAEGSGYFRREWCEIVERAPVNVTSRVRSWDLAASVPSETNPNPDWTAGVKMSKDRYGNYYIEDVDRFRKLPDDVLKDIIDTAKHDGLDSCVVTIPRDPGSAGKTANSFYMRTLAENGVTARSVQVPTHSGKVQRGLPFCTLAQSGAVKVVRGDWNEAWFTELELFEGLKTQKDDQWDATADAFNTLSKEVELPPLAIPNLDQASPVPTLR